MVLARWIVSGAVVALLGLGAAACGDDDDEDTDDVESDDRDDADDSDDTDGDRDDDTDDEASVGFEVPGTGAEVTSPVALEMEAEGVTIEEAGPVRPDAGHLHVMVDVGCVTPGEVIPTDEGYNHFGDGSTSAELDLEPGDHALCLQVGDGAHVAQDITDEITVTVAE